MCPSYAPVGKSLASVTVVGLVSQSDEELEKIIRTQLTDWFGPIVDEWKYLRTYR